MEEERLEAAARNSSGKKRGRAEGQVRLLRARSSTELGKIAPGSATQGFNMAFNATERNERFGRIQCQRSKESSSSRGKGKRRVFFCRKTVGVKVKGKVIPVSFLKIYVLNRFECYVINLAMLYETKNIEQNRNRLN